MNKIIKFTFEDGVEVLIEYPNKCRGLKRDGVRPTMLEPLFNVDDMSDKEMDWYYGAIIPSLSPLGEVVNG